MRSLALLFAVAPIVAQESPPIVDAALRNRFGFLGPKIHKIGDGISLLRMADLDGDGRNEVVVNHSDRGRLAVLKRQDHDSIETEYIDTDGTIYGLELANVNNDEFVDFVMYNRRGRLVVKLGGKVKMLVPDIEVGPAGSYDALRLGDVDGDGAVDAVVLLRDGVRVVSNLGVGAKPQDAMTLDFERMRSFLLEDLNGDSHLDIAILTSRAGMRLHVKFGDGKGDFGPWTLFRTPILHRAFPGPGVGDQPTLTVVQDDRARVVDYVLRFGRVDSSIAPQLTSVPAIKRGSFPFAHGDVDGDGDADLVIAHPERAELIFLLEEKGRFRVRSVPSLSGITSVALGEFDGDGKVDILLASAEEELVAWKSGAQPLDAFPARLPSAENPIAATFTTGGDVVFLTKDKKRQGKLFRVAAGAESAVELGSIGKLGGDPGRLLTGEVDATPGEDLVFVVPNDGVRVVSLASDTIAVDETSGSAGFSKKIEDGALSIVQAKDEHQLMVVRSRFARLFRIDEDGEVAVRRQLNAPSDTGEMALGAVFSGNRHVFVDRKNRKLYLDRENQAVVSFDLPEVGVTHLLEHEGAALLIGRSGVVRMPFDRTWRLDPVRDHEPPTDDTNYWYGVSGDFDGDGADEVVMLDEDINGVQLLVATESKFERALGFPVFELPEKNDRVYEPRAVVVGDWDGDGGDDLVLISHDRVLIYRQEK